MTLSLTGCNLITCKHGGISTGPLGQVADQVVQLLGGSRVVGNGRCSDHLLYRQPATRMRIYAWVKTEMWRYKKYVQDFATHPIKQSINQYWFLSERSSDKCLLYKTATPKWSSGSAIFSLSNSYRYLTQNGKKFKSLRYTSANTSIYNKNHKFINRYFQNNLEKRRRKNTFNDIFYSKIRWPIDWFRISTTPPEMATVSEEITQSLFRF